MQTLSFLLKDVKKREGDLSFITNKNLIVGYS